MILVLRADTTKSELDGLIASFEAQGLKIHLSEGMQHTIMGLVGDTTKLDTSTLSAIDIIESVRRISEPYKLANRKMHPQDSVIDCGGIMMGSKAFNVIAGPCSIESEEQLVSIARSVKASGATMLRGGAFKPRTSPYAFQGLMGDGLKLLLTAKKETGLPVVTEIMNVNHLDMFSDVDVIQVGARNMQNFDLLKELGRCGKPILLKRGLANTLQELLMSAEYIMAGGNSNVILCERGIRTFETATRNTLDISAIPMLKSYTHLPVIVDPSHASGISKMVAPLSRAAVAVGADGLMIEVHNEPAKALCDGAQSLDPERFDELMQELRRRVEFEGRTL